jgi:hypothetical protein
MGMRTPKDINSALGLSATPGIAPRLCVASGDTVNGTGVDIRTLGGGPFASCSLVGSTGAVVGAPTTQTLTIKIQDSADNASFADYIPPTLAAAPTLVITASNTAAKIGVDLSGARQYIRVTATQAFTGGASPQQYANAHVILGGAQIEPATEP